MVFAHGALPAFGIRNLVLLRMESVIPKITLMLHPLATERQNSSTIDSVNIFCLLNTIKKSELLFVRQNNQIEFGK